MLITQKLVSAWVIVKGIFTKPGSQAARTAARSYLSCAEHLRVCYVFIVIIYVIMLVEWLERLSTAWVSWRKISSLMCWTPCLEGLSISIISILVGINHQHQRPIQGPAPNGRPTPRNQRPSPRPHLLSSGRLRFQQLVSRSRPPIRCWKATNWDAGIRCEEWPTGLPIGIPWENGIFTYMKTINIQQMM